MKILMWTVGIAVFVAVLALGGMSVTTVLVGLVLAVIAAVGTLLVLAPVFELIWGVQSLKYTRQSTAGIRQMTRRLEEQQQSKPDPPAVP